MKPISLLPWPLALLLATGSVQAIEFNEDFLSVDPNNPVNLSAFAEPNALLPGKYLVDLYLNQHFIEQIELEFKAAPNSNVVSACIPPELLPRFALKPEVAQAMQGTPCAPLQEIQGASVQYHKASARLAISLPQAALRFQDSHYVPPDAWNDGIPAAFVDYRLSYQQRTQREQGTRQNLTRIFHEKPDRGSDA